LILFNSPYLPSEKDEITHWIDYAWAGGKGGRDVIDRFIASASRYLRPSGRVLLVQSTLSGVDETLKNMESVVSKKYPEIHEMKDMLYTAGASGAGVVPTVSKLGEETTNRNITERFNFYLQYGDPKTVRAVIGFEMDSQNWGETTWTSADAAAGNALKTRRFGSSRS
jgi:hypothetical protein